MGSQCSSVVAVVFACSLAACGGGGSSSPAPSPSNRAPVLTPSATAVSVAENSSGAVFTLSASDPDGDPVSLTLTGDDAASFAIGSGGAVTFKTPPNYDLFADGNGDNSYAVVAQASDGRGGSARTSITVSVTNQREGIRVTRILTGLVDPVGIAGTLESDDEMAVGLKNGSYLRFAGSRRAGDPAPAAALLFPAEYGVRRLLDFAWGGGGNFWSGPWALVENSVGIHILRVNGISEGTVSFGANDAIDGRLFISNDNYALASLGDPGGNYAQATNNPEQNLGNLFHFEAYCGASVRAICATELGLGVRQPGGFAQLDGNILFADQGGSAEHEINLFAFEFGMKQLNFGWPFFEGTKRMREGGPAELDTPVLAYPYGQERKAGTGIVMGAVYAGAIPGIAGHLVFADRNGSIFSIPKDEFDGTATRGPAAIEWRTADFEPDAGTLDSVVEIAADKAGTLYILDADGEVFRVDAG